MRSESCSFIWHPNVVTWKRFTATLRVSRGAKFAAGLLTLDIREEGAPLSELATKQHGVVSVRQLAALGLDKTAVWRWIRAGQLHRIDRGVYAVGHTRLSREGRWMAAVLRCGAGALLSHRSAAALWVGHFVPPRRSASTSRCRETTVTARGPES
jgi:hypothetical protein